MSSLGTKIKEALTGSGPQSSEAAKGEVDRRTPGSFPSDDVPQQSTGTGNTAVPSHSEGHSGTTPDTGLASSGSPHNKLHKPNDPRGWSDSDQVAGAHGHTDSGAGLAQSGTDTLYTSRGVTAPKDTTTGQHDNSSTTRGGLGSTAATAGTTGIAAHEASSHHQHQETSRPGDSTLGAHTQQGDSTGAHWHTQPGGSHATQEGTGTGAGVTGAALPAAAAAKHEHGREGETGNQSTTSPTTQAPYWGDIPHGTGVYNTVTGHGSAEDSQHHEDHQRGTSAHDTTQGTTQTTSGSTQQRTFPLGSSSTPHGDETRNPQESRFREGAVGTGAGAGAGLAAYELQKKYDQRDEQHNLEKDAKHTTSEPTKEKDSKLAGLFQRGDKHDKESKREVKEDKPKHHKEDKDSKVAGILHRDHSDDKDLKHEAKDKDRHAKHTDEATAAAAAAYAAHSTTDDKHKHHDKEDTTQPKEKKESKIAALFHRSSKDKDDESAKEEYHTKKHHEPSAVAAANPATRDHTTRTTPHDTTQTGTARQPGETIEKKQSDYTPGVVAAGAGGAAAYGAYKLGHKDDEKHHDTTTTSRLDKPYAAGTTQGYSSAQGNPSTQGYPATQGYSTTQGYHTTQGHSSAQGYPATQGYSASQGSSAPQGYTAPQPATQSGYTGSQSGHRDQYNELPTGTTSGINTTGTSGPAGYGSGVSSTPQATRDTTTHSDHTGAKYGAAAGLGAAAYQSHTHDTSRDAAPGYQQSQHVYPSTSNNPPSATRFGSSHSSASPTDTRQGTTPAGVTSHSPRDATSGTHSLTHPTTSSGGDGKYNTLSSGTPSGVAIDDNQPSRSSQTGVQSSHHDNNYGSKTAVAGAGAAGAGTAAYLASRGHEKPTEKSSLATELHRKPVAEEKQTAAGGAPIPPTSGGGRVIHKCEQCGEDNDISHYFKK